MVPNQSGKIQMQSTGWEVVSKETHSFLYFSILQMVLKEVHRLVSYNSIYISEEIKFCNLIDLKCNNIHLIMFMVGVCTVQ